MEIKKYKFIFSAEDRKSAYERQIVNIEAFKNIDRTNLKRGEKERRLLLFETEKGEKLYICYPGKESIINDVEKVRPWDFYPILYSKSGQKMPDQSFGNIWDEIDKLRKYDNDYLYVIAALFIKCSLLTDYELVEEDYSYDEIDMISNVTKTNVGFEHLRWWKPKFDKQLMDYINSKNVTFAGGFSPEAYFLYNDLLCQNEDCKYYYRDVKIKCKPEGWDGKTGRRNTYLTHASVVSYLEGNTTFSEIMHQFTHGVAPLIDKKIYLTTNGMIEKIKKNSKKTK